MATECGKSKQKVHVDSLSGFGDVCGSTGSIAEVCNAACNEVV